MPDYSYHEAMGYDFNDDETDMNMRGKDWQSGVDNCVGPDEPRDCECQIYLSILPDTACYDYDHDSLECILRDMEGSK